MIVNGNYSALTANSTFKSETNSVDALATHMNANAEKSSEALDSVSLSPEAYAALKEYAPEALAVLGVDEENPYLEQVKEEAKEKYFHFGARYLDIPNTTEEMISALDVANKFMDSLERIQPDEIYEAVSGSNRESAYSFSSMEDFNQLLEYV